MPTIVIHSDGRLEFDGFTLTRGFKRDVLRMIRRALARIRREFLD